MPTVADLTAAAITPGFGPNALIGDLAGPYVLVSSPVRNIGGLFTDVTIEEVHNDRLEATQHPIQTGATVTDHSFALPATLTIRCGSSDSTAGVSGYIIQQYNAFLALQASRQPFSVSTGKRNYDNMLIRDLQVTTDAQSENIVMFVVQLQQLTFTSVGQATNAVSSANQAMPSETAPTVDMGSQPTLPYFASNTLPAGYTPNTPTSNVGAAGLGGSPFNLTGPAV